MARFDPPEQVSLIKKANNMKKLRGSTQPLSKHEERDCKGYRHACCANTGRLTKRTAPRMFPQIGRVEDNPRTIEEFERRFSTEQPCRAYIEAPCTLTAGGAMRG